MKKLYFSFLICISFSSAFAQWTTGGEQMTFTGKQHCIPQLAATSSGNFFSTWTATDAVGHIMLNAFDINGYRLNGWPVDGIEVSNTGGDYWRSSAFTSEDGNAIVYWFGETTVNTGSERRHVFIQKYDIAGNALWNGGSPIRVSLDTMMHHMNPKAISDGEKGCYIAWRQMDLALSPSSNDIYLQRYDSTGHVHAGWPANPIAIANQPSVSEDNVNLVLSPDKSTLYMCYTTGGINISLKMQGIDPANGSIKSGWAPTVGLSVSPGPNIFPNAGRQPAIYTNANNEVIVIWVEFRNLGEIYIQKISPSGSLLLSPSTGVDMYDLVGDDIVYFDSFMDKDGKIMFAWRIPSGTDDHILMNKTDENGNLQWTNNFTTTSGKSAYPKVVSDGVGGAFLFNKEFGTPDVLYGVRVDSTGSVYNGWSLPGVSFGQINNYDGFNPQRDFQVFSKNDLAVVVWTKKGTDQLYDLYGCSLDGAGNACSATTGITDAVRKDDVSIYPNPTNSTININSSGKNQTIEITNVFGEKVYSSVIGNTTNSTQIDLSTEPNGVYFIRVINGEKSITRKIVKNK